MSQIKKCANTVHHNFLKKIIKEAITKNVKYFKKFSPLLSLIQITSCEKPQRTIPRIITI